MTILLRDSSQSIWSVGVDAFGELTTTPSTGVVTSLVLSDPTGQAWTVGVDTAGELTTDLGGISSGVPQIFFGLGTNYALFVDVLGELQTELRYNPQPWVMNGYGAGTDNRVVGGDGGFMSYPQPPNPIGVGPEANGQFQALVFNYNSSTSQGLGNVFSINNPGRN